MLSLENPRWAELQHAYGSASDIPALLRQLDVFPSSEGNSEPWFSIWSALAHQGDVYSASFAAVPHVIRAAAMDPRRAGYGFFQFPTWVEICRFRNNVVIPEDLQPAYFAALAQLPQLVAAAAQKQWTEDFSLCALAAIAAGKGSHELAATILELTPDTIVDFRSWFDSR
jgi:hypothetical protein